MPPLQPQPDRQTRLLSLSLMLLLMLWFSYRTLTSDVAVLWDANGFLASCFIAVGDFTRAGQLLNWDPFTQAGAPVGVEPQWGARSPLVILTSALLPPCEWSFRFFVWLNWCFGALGLWALGLRLRSRPMAAAAAALTLVTSGFVLMHWTQTVLFYPLLWAPWVLFAFEPGIRLRAWLPPALAGAILGLAGLMSYPGALIAISGFLVCWVALRTFWDPAAPSDPKPATSPLSTRLSYTARALLLCFFVCALVISPVYIGFKRDTAGFSERTQSLTRQEVLTSNPLSPQAALTALSPTVAYAAKASSLPAWRTTDVTGMAAYLPIAGLLLALAGIAVSPRPIPALVLLLIAALGLMTAMSQVFPLRGWLYDFVLPTRYFRHASIFVCVYTLALCLAILVNFPDTPPPPWSKRPLILWLLALTLAAGAIALSLHHVLSTLSAPDRFINKSLLITTGLWALASVGFLIMNLRFKYASPLGWSLLVIAIGIDPILHWGALRPVMLSTDPQRIALWQKLHENHQPSLNLLPHTGTDRVVEFTTDSEVDNKHLMPKIPVLKSFQTLRNPFYDQLTNNPAFQKHLTRKDRFWFSPTIASVPATPQTMADLLAQASQDDQSMPMALMDDSAPAPAGPLPAGIPLAPKLLTYQPDTLDFQITCPQNGWLIVTDRWAPAWSTTVNNTPTPTSIGNFVFRAIPVSQGENRITMHYHPFAQPWLLILSWSTLLLIFAASLASLLRPKTPVATPD
jgi:hypothetical protein